LWVEWRGVEEVWGFNGIVCACPALLELLVDSEAWPGTCAAASGEAASSFVDDLEASDRIPKQADQPAATPVRPQHRHRSSQYPPRNTANMSDDEERVTMPFKFVTGASYKPASATA
jgi:hypothetical protein